MPSKSLAALSAIIAGGPSAATAVVFPLTEPPYYTELVLRGMARMLPGFAGYLDRMPRAYVDGGYYAKTRENRPLIGPLPVAVGQPGIIPPRVEGGCA